jgi:phosphomannomutase
MQCVIFKAYDIRGIVPTTVTEAVAEGIGKAFGTIALAQGEPVGGRRAGRAPERPGLSAALVRGLVAVGIEVIDVGMVTTPMLYFAASTVCATAASRSPAATTRGLQRLQDGDGGRAIYGEDIQEPAQMMETETWTLRDGGTVTQSQRAGTLYRPHRVGHQAGAPR